jgi:hypothetical protein
VALHFASESTGRLAAIGLDGCVATKAAKANLGRRTVKRMEVEPDHRVADDSRMVLRPRMRGTIANSNNSAVIGG